MVRERSRPGVQSEAAEDHTAAGLQSILSLSASPDTVLNPAISSGSDPDVDLVLKLARLVAEEGHLASIINAANLVVRRCDLASAVRSGMAFFVRVCPEVLAADFDTDNAVAGANRLYWRCRMLGLPALLVASGQQGRRHVFCWPKDDPQRAQLAKAAKEDGADVRVDIRPPLTPHRWRAEGVTPEILQGLDIVVEFANTGALPNKPWGKAIIETAIKGGRPGSRSEAIYAVAMAAVNAGWSADQMSELLAATGLAVSEEYLARSKDRGAETTEKWFTDHVWASAERRVSEHPCRRQNPDPTLGQLSAQVEQLAWAGRTGASDRAVYIAMIGKATEVGSLEFRCSQRDLMQRSGLCARKTVQAALKRLEATKLIERNPGRERIAAPVPDKLPRFRFTASWRLTTNHLSAMSPVGASPESLTNYDSLRHDAFLNGSGLGKYAHRIWVALDASPGSRADDLSAGLVLGRRTVEKHLATFHRFGLADHDDEGRWFCVNRPLDGVAADLGNLGRLQQQAAEQARERANYDTFQRHHRQF